MLTRARKLRPKKEQCWLLVRSLILGLFVGFALIGIFFPGKHLYPPITGKPHYPESRNVSNETIFTYAQFNPRLVTERERIQFLLEVTNSGKTNVQEAMKLRKTGGNVSTPMSEQQANISWISPFMELNKNTSMLRFVRISQNWLGDGERGGGQIFHPQLVQDVMQTVKRAMDQNARNLSKTTLPPRPIARDSFTYQSCAVVGNSDTLLHQRSGNLIDSNDMVIRLNNAEISKHKAQVGHKTTLSFMSSYVFQHCVNDSRICDQYEEHVPIVLHICQVDHLLQVAEEHAGNRKSLLIVTSSQFDALCAAIIKWYSVTTFLNETIWGLSEWNLVYDDYDFHYSSGMQAVVLALGMCEHVNLFGLGGPTNPARDHYLTGGWQKSWLHDYVSERRFYDDLAHNRTIPFLSDAGIPLPEVRIFH